MLYISRVTDNGYYITDTEDSNVYVASYPCNMRVVFDKDFNFVEVLVFKETLLYNTDKVGRKFRKQVRR